MQRIAFARSLLLGAALALTPACGSDDDNGGGSGGSGGGGSGGSAGRGGSGGSGGGGAGGGGSGGGGASGGGGGAGGATAGSGGGGAGGGGASGGSGGSGGSAGDASGAETADAPGAEGGGEVGGGGTGMSFFVTSDTRPNGNFGGLQMADTRCQTLATAAGSTKTWRAYLSADMGPEGGPVHARTRIGNGPWFNQKGVMVAMNLTDLHTRAGDYMVLLDEKGMSVNGNWPNSPGPNQHDVMTGSTPDGMLAPNTTCTNWTATTGNVTVGHSDGLGQGGSMTTTGRRWNSAHTSSCANPGSTGGAAKIYCFATN